MLCNKKSPLRSPSIMLLPQSMLLPAKPMQRQPRFRYVSFLVPSVMLFVHRLFGHDVCILVYCPDIPCLFPFTQIPPFSIVLQRVWFLHLVDCGVIAQFPVMLLSIERGKLSTPFTPYTLSQDGVLVFRGLRDAGLGRCIGYFYNLSIPA